MTEQKRILFISHSHLLSGGAELSLLEIVTYFHDQKYKVKVVLPAKGEFSSRLSKLKIPFYIASYGWSAAARGERKETRKSLEIYNADSMIQAYTIMQSYKPNVVFTNTIVVPWYGYVAKALNIPHVLLISETYDTMSNLRLLPGDSEYFNQVKSTTDFIFYNSHFTRSTYGDIFRDIDNEILYPVVSIRPSDLSLLDTHASITGGPLKIIVFGSIALHKNQMGALEALLILVKQGVEAHLTILGATGSEKYLKRLKEFISSNKLTNNVVFLPHSTNPFGVISDHSIVLVPSLCETFGRVTVEGQLLGRVVIGSRAGGTAELIDDHKTGLLYTLGNPTELAEKIKWTLTNPLEAEAIAKLAQEQAIKEFFNTNSNQTAMQRINLLLEREIAQSDIRYNYVRTLIERNIHVNKKLDEYSSALNESIQRNNELFQENEKIKNHISARVVNKAKRILRIDKQ